MIHQYFIFLRLFLYFVEIKYNLEINDWMATFQLKVHKVKVVNKLKFLD